MTIAQSEESCVVYGMPKAAIERGYAIRVVGLDVMAQHCRPCAAGAAAKSAVAQCAPGTKELARKLVTRVIWLGRSGRDIAVERGGLYGAVCTSKTQQGRAAGPLSDRGRLRLCAQEPGPHGRELWRAGGRRGRRRPDRHHRVSTAPIPTSCSWISPCRRWKASKRPNGSCSSIRKRAS